MKTQLVGDLQERVMPYFFAIFFFAIFAAVLCDL